MQPLDLYATIEEYLEFEKEVKYLYQTIKDIAISNQPNSLLDIGCGQGEFCKLMASNGIDTMGVDLSAKQINIAKEKGIDAEHIDIKDISNKYDCATATFDVINYLPKDYIEEFLQHTFDLLNSGGYFIFDINSLFGFDEIAQGTLNIDVEDKFIAIDATFDNEILYTDITLFTKDKECYSKENGTIQQYYYTNDELFTLLTNTGFMIESIKQFNLHSDTTNDKYIFICKKGN